MVGRPLAGNRNNCKAWDESGAKAAVGDTVTIADGGYPGTGLLIPHRRQRRQAELPAWKEEAELALVLAGVPDSLAQTGGDLYAVNAWIAGHAPSTMRAAPSPAADIS